MSDDYYKEKTSNFLNKLDNSFITSFTVYNEISSTNRKARDIADKGGKEGSIVLSKVQKTGRGRFDRSWESPVGGLYLSIILRPTVSPDKSTLLPLVAALAVSKTIDNLGLSSTIKWPNDVRMNGKKVAGILLESDATGDGLNYVVLGMGINLNIELNQLSTDIREGVTSVSHEKKESVDYYMFLENLLSMFHSYYILFSNGRFGQLLDEWKEASDTLSKRVKIVTSAEEIIGQAIDVDRSGFLLLKTDSGDIKKVVSGDCLYFNEL